MQLRELGDWNFESRPYCARVVHVESSVGGFWGTKSPEAEAFMATWAMLQAVNTATQSCIIHLIRVVDSRKAIFWTMISTNK